MKNKTGLILLHITGWIALSLPVLLSPDVSWNFRQGRNGKLFAGRDKRASGK